MVLETADIAGLRTAQVIALTTSDLAALGTSQVAAFSTAGIASLGTSQVVALTTSHVEALNTAQIAALATSQVAVLTTSQTVALETRDIAALRTSQIVALATADIAVLSTSQVEALGTRQVEALTSSQVAAFTTTQISHLHLGTPLVLDLNGDGVSTKGVSAGVVFDLFASGEKVHTGWVSGSDGLLVMDRNHDGLINDGSELFGSATVLASGERAANGYLALAAMDANGDGLISSADAGWADLQVWVDENSDGVTQSGELHSLDSLGIAQMDLAATSAAIQDNGNIEGLISSYQTTDGSTHEMADVWFVADKNEQTDDARVIPPVVSTATSSAAARSEAGEQSPGAATDFWFAAAQTAPVAGVAMTHGDMQSKSTEAGAGMGARDAEFWFLGGGGAAPNSGAEPTPPATGQDLMSRVGGLVQAMGEFREAQSAGSDFATPDFDSASGSALAAAPSVAVNVAGIVESLKQYDPNGNLIAAPIAGNSVATTPALTSPSIPDMLRNGLLASGK